MPQEILRQQNWNGGELDPEMKGRRDLKAYYSTALVLENHITTAQGPLKRRPGFTFRDKVRRRLEAVPFTVDMLSAPNGGETVSLLSENADSMITVTPLSTDDAYVVVAIDFGEPVTVHAVDVIDYGLSEGGFDPTAPGWEYPWGKPGPFDPWVLP